MASTWKQKKRVSKPRKIPPPGAPVIWVGTMYSGEGDFLRCKDSINNQDGVAIVQHTIVNKPEKEAHNDLWNAWMTFRDQHGADLFIKVDADTVLSHETVVKDIWQLFKDNPRVTGVQCPLDDYFTKTHIFGLNCFSPKVTFQETSDELFCDRNVDVDHDIVLRTEQLPISLVPAALHCHFANQQQAFHFGIHRALKGQRHIIDATKQAWLKHKDKTRGFALLGAKRAAQLPIHFNYTDKEFLLMFHDVKERYDSLVKEEL